tara:strand:- start:2344 stop:2661 length:318 start_codon:yes stop_codon:yes gene_type:complete
MPNIVGFNIFDSESHVIVGHDTVTVSTSAVGPTIPAENTTACQIRVNDQSIRWRADGTDPTSSEGFTSTSGDIFILTKETEIDQFKAIRKGGTDSEIDCIFFGEA